MQKSQKSWAERIEKIDEQVIQSITAKFDQQEYVIELLKKVQKLERTIEELEAYSEQLFKLGEELSEKNGAAEVKIDSLKSSLATVCDALGLDSVDDLADIEETCDTYASLENQIAELKDQVPSERLLGALLYLAIPGHYMIIERPELMRRIKETFGSKAITTNDVVDAVHWALERI